MADGDGPPWTTGPLARRRVLALALSTGATAVAGCSASDDGGDADPNGSPTDADGDSSDGNGSPADGERPEEPADEPFPADADAYFQTRIARFSPEQFDWNPFTYFSPGDRQGMFAQWTQYLVGEDEFHPHLVRDWERRDGELVLDLSGEFTWARTGEPVTAADLAFQLSVYEAADHVAMRFLEDVAATERFELTLGHAPETNQELVEYTVLPLLADVPPSNWNDADWEEGPSGVTIRHPDASGPLFLTGIGNYGATTDVRAGIVNASDHALATQYNWAGYELSYVSSEWHPFDDPETDGLTDVVTYDPLPDTVRTFEFPAGFGMALWFDHDAEQWSNRAVRQAFLHAVDREAIVEELSGIPKRRHPAPTGLTAPAVDRWLGAAVPDGFDTYDGGPSEAEERLADAGYAPEDLDVTISFPQGWSDWAVACQSVVDQLRSAGWNATADPISGGPSDAIGDDFDVAAYPFTPMPSYPRNTAYSHHPYFSLEHALRGAPDEDGHFANYDPGTVTVDGEAIDVDAELDRLATTTPRAEQRPIVERLARVVNEDVPCAIVMEKVAQSFIDTEQFAIPEESPHFRTRWPQWWLPKVDERLPGADHPGLLKYDPDRDTSAE